MYKRIICLLNHQNNKMKLSITDCLVVFCVIHLIVTDPIYAGTMFYLRCNVSERKFRCCDDGGKSFISSFYTGNEGTYYSPKIRMMVGLINSTCKIIQTILILIKLTTF
ncbi:unnamed protein product [Schistosoma haematobium]|nr:unnamed protein product [Schistosoma haematobium]